jgi:hypothetical protein
MTQYANALRREDEMGPMAKNLMAMDDAFQADDFERDKLLRLSGTLLGYSEANEQGRWIFRSPRKLPAHLSKVYKIGFGVEDQVHQQELCLAELLAGQIAGGVEIGALLAGERPLQHVRVGIPGEYFAHHIGIFGRTGTGKSNNLMVLIQSILRNNRRLFSTPPQNRLRNDRVVSLFAIDPHDEFAKWKPGSGGGITRLIRDMSAAERAGLVEPFFYLSCRPQAALSADAELGTVARQCVLHRHDITPTDLISTHQAYAKFLLLTLFPLSLFGILAHLRGTTVRWLSGVYYLLLLLALALVIKIGSLGGELVFVHGAGVQPRP